MCFYQNLGNIFENVYENTWKKGFIEWEDFYKDSMWPPKYTMFWKGWIEGIDIFFKRIQEELN
jgi:hypothetical protein